MIKTVTLLLTLCYLSLNVLGQSTDTERELELRKIDKIFNSTFSAQAVKDSSATYVFAIKVSLEDRAPKVERNDSLLNTFYPTLKSRLSTEIDFRKILPRKDLKEVIIPMIISILGTNQREYKMISELEALKSYDKRFYDLELLSNSTSFIMKPRRIVADVAIYD